MSENAQMTYQDASNFLINNVYVPVFFEKLAQDYGINPSSEQEAQGFLSLAGKLEQLYSMDQTKQASTRVDVLSKAHYGLDQILNHSPYQGAYTVQDQEVKQAAAELSQVQQFRDAALLYQDAMQQLMSQS